MVWLIRLFFLFVFAAPLVGALQPIVGLDTGGIIATRNVLVSPEALMISRVGVFALSITILTAIPCVLFAPIFVKRTGIGYLRYLIMILTALFFIPTTIKVYAFRGLWFPLTDTGVPDVILYLLWSITFNAIFYWVAIFAFADAPRNRAVLDGLDELVGPARRAFVIYRLLLLPISLASICTFTFTFFAGIELRLLMPKILPVGDVISELFGGRELEAAQLSAIALAIVLGTAVIVVWLGRRVLQEFRTSNA